MSKLLFDPGRILMTPGAMESLVKAKMRPSTLVLQHCALEQGELNAADHRENLSAFKCGLRVFSHYKTTLDEELWVISEFVIVENGGDTRKRETTTILRPDEY